MIPTKKILHHLSTHLGQKNAMFIVSITPSSHQKRKKKNKKNEGTQAQKNTTAISKAQTARILFFL
jgi:hypothetical protein